MNYLTKQRTAISPSYCLLVSRREDWWNVCSVVWIENEDDYVIDLMFNLIYQDIHVSWNGKVEDQKALSSEGLLLQFEGTKKMKNFVSKPITH